MDGEGLFHLCRCSNCHFSNSFDCSGSFDSFDCSGSFDSFACVPGSVSCVCFCVCVCVCVDDFSAACACNAALCCS
ncbi:hypothetical protein ACFWP7_09400 [Streptomyces sp. NPDC058470]|uniref:hypothetical protein n=1 Tax=Streptomyces sp. NPDC058470 TaxID=3346515 RepID=UPI00364D59F6